MKKGNRIIKVWVCGIVFGLCTIGKIAASVDTVYHQTNVKSMPANNPGYLGYTKAITLSGVTNFTKILRSSGGYHTNYAINFEMAKKASLSYQFGYKGIHSTIEQGDWDAYDVNIQLFGGGWGGTKYRPVGTMDIQYKEFTVGVKNYMSAFGSSAPYGVYTVANLHVGLAKSTSSDLRWVLESGSQDLPSYDGSAVKGSLISMSYGFGSRNMIANRLGLVMEFTSGLTLKNSGGFSVYTQDAYSSGSYHGVDQADVMRRVMLREFHKSQWVQFKLGLGYLLK